MTDTAHPSRRAAVAVGLVLATGTAATVPLTALTAAAAHADAQHPGDEPTTAGTVTGTAPSDTNIPPLPASAPATQAAPPAPTAPGPPAAPGPAVAAGPVTALVQAEGLADVGAWRDNLGAKAGERVKILITYMNSGGGRVQRNVHIALRTAQGMQLAGAAVLTSALHPQRHADRHPVPARPQHADR